MLRRKLLSFVLSIMTVLCCVYPIFPVYATKESLDVFVNPIYADSISEEDVLAHAESIHTYALYAMDNYVDYDTAVSQLSNALYARSDTATVYIKSPQALPDGFYTDIFYKALEHDGLPTHGDYALFSAGGCAFRCGEYIYGGTYYYSVTFTPIWHTTKEQEKELDTAVKNLLDTLDLYNKGEYEKIRGVYDYICKNITYDNEHLKDESYTLKFTAYAALINKTAVCQGYAGLLYRLLLELGVDCRVISGDAGGPHGWNIAKIGGLYYNLDSTWDAVSVKNYRYFLLGSTDFTGHTRDLKYTTPEFEASYPMAKTKYQPEQPTSVTLTSGVKWEINKTTGALTLSGNGSVPAYANGAAPWSAFAGSIKEVSVGNGITALEAASFTDLSALKNISVSNTNQSYCDIDGVLFTKNKKTLVKFPQSKQGVYTVSENVTAISASAFKDAKGITSVYIENNALAQQLTSASALGSLCTAVKSVAVKKDAALTSYLKNNFSRSAEISFNGTEYILRANHTCSWTKDGTESDGHDNVTTHRCSSCLIKKQTVTYTHNYTSTVIPPERGAEGYTLHTCVCGDSYKDSFTPALPDYEKGDINGDDKVTDEDADLLMRYIAGWNVKCNQKALDVNGDGKVNNRDAARLMQFIAGWNVTLA